jgi:uncharacterized protein (TIGR01777 family)
MKIAIAGATGFVGSRLVAELTAQGHEILILTRSPQQAKNRFPQAEIVGYTPLKSGEWQQSISGCDAVVNLAGEPIAEKRWTPAEKQEILASRQITTQKIVEAIERAAVKPKVLVSASAVGYYGTSTTVKFDETSPPGDDYLAEVCQAWETAAQSVSSDTRLVILRFGIVLGEGGGVLGKMLPVFQSFVGGPIGSGDQWVSWIHRDDLVKLIITALKSDRMQGIYNATAPHPVTMQQLAQGLGEVISRPSWLPVPGFVLETMLGEGAKIVLEGQQVLPQRIRSEGFTFQYPELKPALESILRGRQ